MVSLARRNNYVRTSTLSRQRHCGFHAEFYRIPYDNRRAALSHRVPLECRTKRTALMESTRNKSVHCETEWGILWDSQSMYKYCRLHWYGVKWLRHKAKDHGRHFAQPPETHLAGIRRNPEKGWRRALRDKKRC